ncbi:MAG TPA: ATP-binding protein [Luteimonas sp.]|nr:ATP-binding protein [Luteimonas sp.]
MAGWLAIGVGMLVLAGWAWNIDPLKRVLPGLVSMNPATAVGFLFAGWSLWLQHRDPAIAARTATTTSLARGAAMLVVAIGALRLAGYALDWHHGVDQLLFADKLLHDTPSLPNRMAPNTALNLVLLGLALFMLDVTTARNRRPAELFSASVVLLSLLAMFGYAYQVPQFYDLAAYIPMALPTAIVSSLLALGILCARPGRGLMVLATSASLGGSQVRRLFPAMVLALFVLGWLRLEGERRGLYGRELGVALYTLANITIFGALVGWSASALHRSEVERGRAGAGRAEALALNRMIMDNSLDVICAIDGDGRFVEVSAASESLWGYAPSELVGRAYAELVHPDDIVRSAEAAGSVMSGQPAVDFNNRYRRKDGRMIDIDWSAAWSEPGGMMFCVARDATGRKLAEQAILALNSELAASAAELQQTNHELESFSYSVSHDLRAPLRHIDGYARMLQEDAAGQLDAEMRRYLDAISASARNMGVLIDDLLAFSRLGRQPVERIVVDMNALTERALHEVGGGRPGGPRVQVAPLPPAHGDPVLLRQVWVNLLSNALKYSAKRGDAAQVEVSGERDGDVTRYRVRDNGVGFDMRYADKLFGVFQRLHSQDEFEGTGVGLAIVQRVVTRHGGRVWAEAELDRGATFTIELPVAETPAMEDSA